MAIPGAIAWFWELAVEFRYPRLPPWQGPVLEGGDVGEGADSDGGDSQSALGTFSWVSDTDFFEGHGTDSDDAAHES